MRPTQTVKRMKRSVSFKNFRSSDGGGINPPFVGYLPSFRQDYRVHLHAAPTELGWLHVDGDSINMALLRSFQARHAIPLKTAKNLIYFRSLAGSETLTVVPLTSESAGFRMTRSAGFIPARISTVGPKSRPSRTDRNSTFPSASTTPTCGPSARNRSALAGRVWGAWTFA